MILLDNREVKKGWQPLKEIVDGVLAKNGAELVVAKRWDERKLAYEIRRQRRATYYLAYFNAAADAITGINRGLKLTAPVLRSLVLRCEEIPPEAYEAEREFDIDRQDEPKAGESESGESGGEVEGEDVTTEAGKEVEDSESGGDASASDASQSDASDKTDSSDTDKKDAEA